MSAIRTHPMQARPTVYKGIRMRSRLEALYAAGFDDDGIPWEYEPECFADDTGQYLPDFRFSGVDDYLEVKGVVTDPIPIMTRMEIILSSRPDAHLQIDEGTPGEGRQWIGRRMNGGDWFVWIDLNERSRWSTAVRAIRMDRTERYIYGLEEPPTSTFDYSGIEPF